MIDNKNIKNIIFDFGGVIINIDFRLTWESFKNYGVADLDQLFSKVKQTALFDNFEKGLISPDEFRKQAIAIMNIDIDKEEFDKAWNSMILDIPEERINLLRRLRNNYRIFLLSNSNKIHYDFYLNNLKRVHHVMRFEDLFEKVYFSFNTGLIKPDKEIFNRVIAENALKVSETIFIDDSVQHINAAGECGLLTLHLEEGTICDLF